MDIVTIVKRFKELNLTIGLPSFQYNTLLFNPTKCQEHVTFPHYGLIIKGYKILPNFSIKFKTRIGSIMLEFLNNSKRIINLLEDYKKALSDSQCITDEEKNSTAFYMLVFYKFIAVMYYDLLKISPYNYIIINNIRKNLNHFNTLKTLNNLSSDKNRIQENYIECIINCINSEIHTIKSIQVNIKKMYSKNLNNKKGYIKYNKAYIIIPNCKVYFYGTKKNSKPSMYKYSINDLFDLYYASIYSLSLTNYKVYNCNICGKYFISKKMRKTCSQACENKAIELGNKKNKSRKANTTEVDILYKKIKNFYNRGLKNKNKQDIRNKMRRNFEIRYNKKIITLNKQYKSSLNKGYQNQLLIWLKNEYEKIQKIFPSNKFGNTNHSKK